MGALTQKERDGLDDLFLSLNSRTNKGYKISLILTNLLQEAKYGLKETYLFKNLLKLSKKKNFLSK